jgi:hypothetical protein
VNKRLIPLAALGLLPLTLMACGGDDTPATAKEGDAFCKAAEDASETFDEFDTVDFTDPDAVEDSIKDSVDAAKEVAAIAPTDIKEELNELVDIQTKFLEILEDNDFDFVAAAGDPDFEDLADDGEDTSDKVEEYLEEKCGIEPSDDGDDEASGTDETIADGGTDETVADGGVPGGSVTAEEFLDFYAAGAGVEITDEMKACFVEETSELTAEDFGAVMGTGEPSEDVAFAIGSAVLACGIPITE